MGSAIRGGSATPDGSAIALVDEAGSVGVWDLRNGSRILALPSDTVCDSSGCPEVFWVSLSDGAHLLATGDGDGVAHLWDLRSGREVVTVSTDATAFAATFGGPFAPAAALSPDGRLLATGGRDGFRLWDVATGAQARTLPRVSSPWTVPRFSPDGTWLFYCAVDDDPGAAPAGHPAKPGAVNVITGETTVFRGGFFGCGAQFSADSSRVALLLLRGSLADAAKDPTNRDRPRAGDARVHRQRMPHVPPRSDLPGGVTRRAIGRCRRPRNLRVHRPSLAQTIDCGRAWLGRENAPFSPRVELEF